MLQKIRFVWIFPGIILISLLAYRFFPSSPVPPPERLYLLDVSDMHLNHYEYCLSLGKVAGSCTADTPPPDGKSYNDLLRDYDTLIFITTLQGIVNRNYPQLYLNHDHQRIDTPGVDAFWLAKYQEKGKPYGWLANTEIIKLSGLSDLLDRFADEIDGVVLWDAAVPATLNAATTIAGVENLAVLRAGSEIEAEVTARLKVKKSLVGLFRDRASTLPDSNTLSSGSAKNDVYLWAKEKYLDTGLANPAFLAYLEDGLPAKRYLDKQMTMGGVYALERDYVVQQRGFAFDLSPWLAELPDDDPNQPVGTDATTFQIVVKAASEENSGGLIKVWGFIPWYEKYAIMTDTGFASPAKAVKGEWDSTWLFSQYGGYLQGGGGDVYGVAMANISVHKFGTPPAKRTTPKPPTEEELIKRGYLTTGGDVVTDSTFVLFYAGDYDLAHPVYTLMANYASKPWLDSRRGDIPLAWGVNPALVEDIPAIMSYLYSTSSEADYFVAANSGAGYLNPDALSDVALLRWLYRSRSFYHDYGYNIQGFLLNGNGKEMSQRRLDAFTYIAPVGILSLDFETDEPWPRLQRGTPLSTLARESLGGTPDSSALAIHTAYQRVVITEGRPPFLAFRSAFQSPTFLWGVRDRLQAHDVEGLIVADDGQILHPNYTVVDPYSFFTLLKLWLEEHPVVQE